ncbi:hypothetical protein H7U12_17760, partial [Rufibacter sp. H-1]
TADTLRFSWTNITVCPLFLSSHSLKELPTGLSPVTGGTLSASVSLPSGRGCKGRDFLRFRKPEQLFFLFFLFPTLSAELVFLGFSLEAGAKVRTFFLSATLSKNFFFLILSAQLTKKRFRSQARRLSVEAGCKGKKNFSLRKQSAKLFSFPSAPGRCVGTLSGRECKGKKNFRTRKGQGKTFSLTFRLH